MATTTFSVAKFSSLLLAGLGLLAGARPAFSQPADADRQLAASIAAAQQQYDRAFPGNPKLINGPEYVDYARPFHERRGHQFFLAPGMQAGSVHYNGQHFSNLRLAYDVVYDQVILPQPTSPLLLRLVDERVRYFYINGHHFIRLVADSAAGKVIRTGYYEVLADSGVQVLAKRIKQFQQVTDSKYVNAEFTVQNKLFIRKAGIYYSISKKSALLRLLSDHGPELQRYLQSHRLSFRKAQFEASAVELVRYYNTLPVH